METQKPETHSFGPQETTLEHSDLLAGRLNPACVCVLQVWDEYECYCSEIPFPRTEHLKRGIDSRCAALSVTDKRAQVACHMLLPEKPGNLAVFVRDDEYLAKLYLNTA